MGSMTNVTILNDHFDWIIRNPDTFVKAIQYGMNSGTDSPIEETFCIKEGRSPNWHETDEERAARIHYVTVHKAQHMDTPQIIFTEANGAWPIHELDIAIARGWIEQKSNPRTYIRILRGIINKLRWYADRVETELDAAERRLDAAEVDS